MRPGGTVQFTDGGTPIGSPQSLISSNGFSVSQWGSIFALDASLQGHVSYLLTSDLNGDSVADLLAVCVFQNPQTGAYENILQSFVSNGKGGYTASALQSLNNPLSTLPQPASLDVNGDGKQDLLIGRSVSYGNGDGTFQQPVPVSFLSNSGSGTLTYAADINGDGKTDIVSVDPSAATTQSSGYALMASVWINAGSGNFNSSGSFPLATFQYSVGSYELRSLSFVDLNGDGKLDMVPQIYAIPFGQAEEPATITAVLNEGNGAFGSPIPVSYSITQYDSSGPSADWIELGSMQVADFNGDGKPDLALIYAANGTTSSSQYVPMLFLPGNGDGSFGSQVYSKLLPTPVSNANQSGSLSYANALVQDVNLDGQPDILFGNGEVAVNAGSGNFSVGPAVFTPPASGAPYSAQAVVAALQMPGEPVASLVYAGSLGAPAQVSVIATPETTSSATLAVGSLTPGEHSITADYSGSSLYAGSESEAVIEVVQSAAATIMVKPPAGSAYASQSFSYAISVNSSGTVPTGSVSLSSAGSRIGQATLDAQGNATVPVSFPNAGSFIVTVAYSGDAMHAASSTTVQQTIVAPVSLTTTNQSSTVTVTSGGAATLPLAITAVQGFSGSVSFTCQGLPSGSSCLFQPASVNVSSGSTQTTVLRISAGGPMLSSMLFLAHGSSVAYAGLMLGGLFAFSRKRRSHMSLIVGSVVLLMCVGCGVSSTPVSAAGLAAGTYNFQVVATSGSVQTTTPYTLVVQ